MAIIICKVFCAACENSICREPHIDLLYISFKNCANRQLQFIYVYYLKSRLPIRSIDFYFLAMQEIFATHGLKNCGLFWSEWKNCPLNSFLFEFLLNREVFPRPHIRVYYVSSYIQPQYNYQYSFFFKTNDLAQLERL